jgi:hypothetical protein
MTNKKTYKYKYKQQSGIPFGATFSGKQRLYMIKDNTGSRI